MAWFRFLTNKLYLQKVLSYWWIVKINPYDYIQYILEKIKTRTGFEKNFECDSTDLEIFHQFFIISRFFKINPELWRTNRNYLTPPYGESEGTIRAYRIMVKTIYRSLKSDHLWSRNCRSKLILNRHLQLTMMQALRQRHINEFWDFYFL